MRICLPPDAIRTPSLPMYLTVKLVPVLTASGFESSSGFNASAFFTWPQAEAARRQTTAKIFVVFFIARVIRDPCVVWFRLIVSTRVRVFRGCAEKPDH